jgi:Fe-S-cluster containining protein
MKIGSPREELLTLQVELDIGGEPSAFDAIVPRAPARPRRLLPLLQTIAAEVVDRAEHDLRAAGRSVSCKPRCASCCRLLNTISKAEAHRIREVVEAMPEPRRDAIRSRCLGARRRLEDAGLGALYDGAKGARDAKLDPERIATDYFALRLACPFLEDEMCSIYEERPLNCREYMVSSPAEHCSERLPEDLERVPLAIPVSQALRPIEQRDGDGVGWVLLAIAPLWAEEHPDVGPKRPGPDLVREALRALAGEPKKKRAKQR